MAPNSRLRATVPTVLRTHLTYGALVFGALGSGVLARPAIAQAVDAAPESRAPNTLLDANLWNAIVTEGKEKSKVMAFLDHLVNRIGPRLTSSRNLDAAQEWAVSELKAMGYANARLERWGEFPVGFDRGPASGAITAPDSLRGTLAFCTNAWSAGTKGPQEGRVVLSPEDVEAAEDAVRAKPDAFRDAWILRRQSLRRSGVSELADYLEEHGALGFVYSGNETRPGKEDKNELHRNLLMTGGRQQIRWPDLPTFPQIQVRWDQFQELANAVDAGTEVRLRFDIRNWFRQGPIPVYNVVAELEGYEKPHEYVVVGAHIDSWDGATGTTDNGTGTSTTLEAARILAAVGARPRRTIRFMLWSGEEQGLLGSRAWVQKHRQDVVANCQAALVHDGGTNAAVGILGTSAQLPFLERAFAGFDTIDPALPFTVTEGRQPSYGSDHVSFITVGAPAFYWLQKGRARYNYGHHTQHDTFALAVPEYQRQTATVAALGALALANIEERMPPPVGRATSRRPAIPSTGISVDKDLQVTIASKEGILGSAGVQAGDVLVSLDGETLSGGNRGLRAAFVGLLRSGKERSTVVVRRGGETLSIPLKLTNADEPSANKNATKKQDEPSKRRRG
ncbi:MAG: M20/M25/M40 family metallo-hydrolase [Planctomycetes bacterium]|nr:M20/M25/M40 family metallo-hydrolase [Planctomycetota bacterium]